MRALTPSCRRAGRIGGRTGNGQPACFGLTSCACNGRKGESDCNLPCCMDK
jgi:hypothetical protein